MRSNNLSLLAAKALKDIGLDSPAMLVDPSSLLVLEAREDERRKIARDLHDVTAQLLLELQFALDAVASNEKHVRDRARNAAHDAISKLQAQVRCISYLLHPPELSRFGLQQTLESLALGMGERCGIKVRFHARGYRGGIPAELEKCFLRIAQEALMNIFKHSRSDRVEFHFHCGKDWICMRIRDFGIGRHVGQQLNRDRGVGLRSMKDRMDALGGRLTIRSFDCGTAVTAVTRFTPGEEDGGRYASAFAAQAGRILRVQ